MRGSLSGDAHDGRVILHAWVANYGEGLEFEESAISEEHCPGNLFISMKFCKR